MNLRKPHLRIAVTSDCNFSCEYCRDGGEGILSDNDMSLSQFKAIAELAQEVGFSHVKLTGGEPLLREERHGDIIPLIKYLKSDLGYEDVQLVTNGYFLKKYAEDLATSGLDSLTVSLDTASQEEFYKITKVDAFAQVIEGVELAKANGLDVIFNCVFYKRNLECIFSLIELALNLEVNIKILDCVDFPGSSETRYVSFDTIYHYLEESKGLTFDYMLPPGGLGTPMRRYISGKTKIILKDAKEGTNYNKNVCTKCDYYPCQDALISLRITANGYLKRCLIRDDNLVEFRTDLENKNYKSVKEKLADAFNILMEAEYHRNKWNGK